MKIFAQVMALTMAAMMLTACGGDKGTGAASAPATDTAAESGNAAVDTMETAADDAKAMVADAVEVAEEAITEAKDDLMDSQSKDDAEAAIESAKDTMKDMEMDAKAKLDGM